MTSERIDLATEVKAWRGKVPARLAAERLGISRRTLEGVEQGRGFAYPSLLRLAMTVVDPNEASNETS